MLMLRSGTMVAALALLNAFLLSVLGYEAVSLKPDYSGVAMANQQPVIDLPKQNPEPITRHSIKDYDAVILRPLFNSDRLPIEETDSAEVEEEALGFRLVGVVLTSEQQVAIVYSENQKRPVRVILWDWIDGWRVVSIELQKAELRKGSRTLELELERSSKAEVK